MPRQRSPTWVVSAGQFGIRTVPPVARAAARKGPALERSCSIRRSKARIGPGETTQWFGTESSTATPTPRSTATVMLMWSRLGTGLPTCSCVSRWSPSVKRAPASSRAETNWDEALASMTRWPPRTSPVPWTVNGNDDAGPPSGAVTATPRPARASIMVPMGRLRACGSPSKRDSPRRSAATGGTKRMTVPARPQSIAVSAAAASMLIGTISRSGPKAPSPGTSVTVAPNCRRASIISAESRECRGARSREGPSARAASTRYRLVRDLDPGTVTVASTGRAAKGAGQCGPRCMRRRQGGTGQLQRGWCQSLPS